MQLLKLTCGLANLLLTGNGVKYSLEKKIKIAAPLLTGGLLATYLSPYNHFNADSLSYYAFSGIGASSVSNIYGEQKQKGIAQFLLGSAAMALHLSIFKPDHFFSHPWVCGFLVSTALTTFSGHACWAAEQIALYKTTRGGWEPDSRKKLDDSPV